MGLLDLAKGIATSEEKKDTLLNILAMTNSVLCLTESYYPEVVINLETDKSIETTVGCIAFPEECCEQAYRGVRAKEVSSIVVHLNANAVPSGYLKAFESRQTPTKGLRELSITWSATAPNQLQIMTFMKNPLSIFGDSVINGYGREFAAGEVVDGLSTEFSVVNILVDFDKACANVRDNWEKDSLIALDYAIERTLRGCINPEEQLADYSGHWDKLRVDIRKGSYIKQTKELFDRMEDEEILHLLYNLDKRFKEYLMKVLNAFIVNAPESVSFILETSTIKDSVQDLYYSAFLYHINTSSAGKEIKTLLTTE